MSMPASTADEANAREWALWAHSGQVDLAGVPYNEHVSTVAHQFEAGTVERIVGWLHDIVEDTEVTLDAVRNRFSSEVADAVDSLTRRDTESYAQYIIRCCMNPVAVRVKLADNSHNLDPDRGYEHPDWGIDRYERARARLEAAAENHRERHG